MSEEKRDDGLMTCINCGVVFDSDDEIQSAYHEGACDLVDGPWKEAVAVRLRKRGPASGEGERLNRTDAQLLDVIVDPINPTEYGEARKEALRRMARPQPTGEPPGSEALLYALREAEAGLEFAVSTIKGKAPEVDWPESSPRNALEIVRRALKGQPEPPPTGEPVDRDTVLRRVLAAGQALVESDRDEAYYQLYEFLATDLGYPERPGGPFGAARKDLAHPPESGREKTDGPRAVPPEAPPGSDSEGPEPVAVIRVIRHGDGRPRITLGQIDPDTLEALTPGEYALYTHPPAEGDEI